MAFVSIEHGGSTMVLNENAVQFLTQHFDSPEFQVVPLAGDASSRRYYRIVHQEKSWVLMVWEPFENPETFPFINVQTHLKKHHVHVPDIIQFSKEEGLILLEDLGDLTLERKFWENQNQEVAIPFYKQAIDELIKIHFLATADRPEADSSSTSWTPPCTAFTVAFDTAKLLWEMNYGREHLMEKLNPGSLTKSFEIPLKVIFEDICKKLSDEPRYIAHRDYHSRNLMLKFGKMRVIDFQDARLGPIQYDLVSLLHDSYVNLNDRTRFELLNYYLDAARPHLPKDFSREHFDRIFKLQIVQRCFKACGSFSSFYNLRKDRRYLKYIEPTINKVSEVLELFPEYKEFHSVLLDSGILERKYDDL